MPMKIIIISWCVSLYIHSRKIYITHHRVPCIMIYINPTLCMNVFILLLFLYSPTKIFIAPKGHTHLFTKRLYAQSLIPSKILSRIFFFFFYFPFISVAIYLNDKKFNLKISKFLSLLIYSFSNFFYIFNKTVKILFFLRCFSVNFYMQEDWINNHHSFYLVTKFQHGCQWPTRRWAKKYLNK